MSSVPDDVVPLDSESNLTTAEESQMLSGKYQLFASIGSGGMAEVFLGVARGPRGFNKLVVIKKLRANLATDEDNFVNMFLDEARLAARLNHPNIVSTYEVGEHESSLFIAMEFLDGQSLRSLLARTTGRSIKVPVNIAVHVAIEALKGLHCAHELRDYDGSPLGVVHRDVSPHNIFLTYEGAVKLVDFGIAKANLNSADTVAGTFKGKPGYMAPEQLTNECDRRTDLFSMGIVLFEMVTGTRMFPGLPIKALHALMAGDYPRMLDRLPDADPALAAIVDKALAQKADDRYPTAEAMQNALEDWMRAHSTRTESKEIGGYLSELFKETRETIRKQIEIQMAKTSTGSGLSLHRALVNPPSLAKIDVEPSVSGAGAVVMMDAEAEPRSRRKLVIFGAVGVGVAILAAVLLLRSAPPAPAVVIAPPPVVVPPSVPAVAPRVGALVTVVTDPGGATVSWSGRTFGPTPTNIELPPGVQVLKLHRDGSVDAELSVDVPKTADAPILKSVTMKPTERPFWARPTTKLRRGLSAATVAQPLHVAPAAPTHAPAPVESARKPNVIIIDDGKPKVRVIE